MESGPYSTEFVRRESYHGPPRPLPLSSSYDLMPYSSSYAQTQTQTQMANNNNKNSRDSKLKKGKSSTKFFSFNDPEMQRKKRVATYKMYSAEGKMKGSLRNSFRWLKDKYTQVLYGWW